MILIFSILEDPSTNHIVDWLTYYGEKVFRINSSDDVVKYFERFPNTFLSSNSSELKNDSIKSVWFRRPPLCITHPIFRNREKKMIDSFFTSEHKAVFDILFTTLKNKKWLNDEKSSRPRKLDQLLIAKDVGLLIPNTAIIGTKSEMVDFCQKNKRTILKPIQDPRPIYINRKMYLQYTALVTKNLIKILPEVFYPCLFQQFIDKNLEIRTFYLNEKCYSMAICSTFDRQTKIDFRRYNGKKPNRKVPYKLPLEIEEKIKNLMSKLKLNCGSLDFILDNHGKYFFLEVNPVGQFGMVSFPCNYNLEKLIADFLIDDNDKK